MIKEIINLDELISSGKIGNHTWEEMGDLTFGQAKKMTKEQIDKYVENYKKKKVKE